MRTFSVYVNGSSHYVVSARHRFGAGTSALSAIEGAEPDAFNNPAARIRIARVMISQQADAR